MRKLLLVLFLCVQLQAHGAGIQFGNLIPNFVGVGVGSTSDWSGSKDYIAGVAPGARYAMEDKRYAEWYGTYAGMKINTHENFEFGPAIVFRMGRKDVMNDQVNELPDIDLGVDLGAFIGYAYSNTEAAIPYYSRVGMLVTQAVAGGSRGTNVNIYQYLDSLEPEIVCRPGAGRNVGKQQVHGSLLWRLQRGSASVRDRRLQCQQRRSPVLCLAGAHLSHDPQVVYGGGIVLSAADRGCRRQHHSAPGRK